jgi:hypothetical protein
MKLLRKALLVSAVLSILYCFGYLISAHRFVGYSGSAPIYDPDWTMTVDFQPYYTLFNPQFWSPVHSIDRSLRPDYWTFTVRADTPPTEIAIGKIVFEVPPRPMINRIFPTLMDVQ